MWCHFSQRLQRPYFMQAAKPTTRSSRVSHLNHQDERYSYVVLRRGPRPGRLPDWPVSRDLEGASSQVDGFEDDLEGQEDEWSSSIPPSAALPEAQLEAKMMANRLAALEGECKLSIPFLQPHTQALRFNGATWKSVCICPCLSIVPCINCSFLPGSASASF